MALLYKSAMWQLYRSAELPPAKRFAFRRTKTYQFADWTSESLKLELATDTLTIVIYATATALLLSQVLIEFPTISPTVKHAG